MKARVLVIAVGLAALVGTGIAGLPVAAPYAHAARVDYLRRALAALRELGPDRRAELEQAMYLGARARCRAADVTPSITCTIELADATCDPRRDRDACRLAADVILTNQRAATELVDEATRIKLVAGAPDYHVALVAELDARYAALAAELVLAAPEPLTAATLPARIDRFCAEPPPAAAPRPDWQRCAAALIWYIAGKELP